MPLRNDTSSNTEKDSMNKLKKLDFIPGQEDIFSIIPEHERKFVSCSDCICRDCLYYWSMRCPSACKEQGCHNGIFRPANVCMKYIRYKGQEVKTCLKANVSVFQDGYISCCLLENYGCEKCYAEFEKKCD